MSTANKRVIKGTKLAYPVGRRSKLHPNGVPNKYADKELLMRFKAMAGQPNVTRDKRALIKEFNPLHFSLGETLPVWKTWQTYAQNMGLLEDEDNQGLSQAQRT